MVLNDSRTDDMASDVLRERCIVTSLCIIAFPIQKHQAVGPDHILS